MPEPFNNPPEPPPDSALVWRAKCGAILLALFLVAYVGFFLIPGIYTGSITEWSKRGTVVFNRQDGPVSYWFTVGFHATVAVGVAYLEYLCLVGARWIERKKSIDTAAAKTASLVPDSSKPMPLWVTVMVIGGFFYFLFILFAKAGGH